MAGMNLHALVSPFGRFLRHGNRRPFFARRCRLHRLGRGAGFRRHGRGTSFHRNSNGSSLRHRAGLGGRRRPFGLGGQRRPFNWNRRRHGGRRHGNSRQAYAPRSGRGAQAVAVNAQGLHAAPAAPPSPSAPLQPAFHIPPMDWLLRGPAAPFLGEEDDFDAALAPPPPGIFLDNGMDAGVAFCPEHGYGPCPARMGIAFCPMQSYGASPPPPAAHWDLPTPTLSSELEEYEFPPGLGPDAYLDLPTPTPALSDEDPEHFLPPGYGPVPGLESPPPAEETGAPPAAELYAFDLNVEAEPEDEETGAPVAAAPFAFDLHVKAEPEDEETGAPVVADPPALDLQVQVKAEDKESLVAAPASPQAQATQPAAASTPPPEARRLLRRFAAAMASRQPGFRPGAWNPASLGFSSEEERGGRGGAPYSLPSAHAPGSKLFLLVLRSYAS
ncbi:unnamed protein product [Alopecurus aequalis]